ncbi:hypothetical protein [Cohaesibacter gelatinilyticus]|uniref:Uncharacterized protein n=1 Tax=Cohaesibacter gelatinilyticus TaxID=372072 RepID=A0A285ND14_9HYPH|nr:hypothetical protein [Cohaesibacter gelatinilyticus]SNZ07414.1 hypothetical protein SAMN06265368_0933 [Cohaesibacter gelatinilyticus]
MNIPVFGKIIAAAGAIILALSLISVYWTAPDIISEQEWKKWAKQYSRPQTHFGVQLKRRNPGSYRVYVMQRREVQTQHATCLVSRFGSRSCPIGGYSAIFTYVGAFFLLVGGGLIIASRKPPAPQLAKE